jgi:hypothetical protein
MKFQQMNNIMNKSLKKRLCWNCEGSVSVSEETCPFCGVSVVPAFLEGTTSSFAPPYAMGSTQDSMVPRSPYDRENDPSDTVEAAAQQKEADEAEPAIDEFKSVMLSVTFLLSGSVFLMFGTVLALFSQDGVLKLQWDGAYWYVYLLLAVPMFFFGWRFLKKLD